MKFGQLGEYTREIYFFKNHAKNEAERLVPDIFLLFEKGLYEVNNASGLQVSLNIFR